MLVLFFFFFFLAKVSSLFEKIKVSKTGRILWSIVGGATPLTGTWATFPGEKKNQKKSKKNRKHGFALERESWVLNTLSLNLENSHALITPLVIKRAIYSPFRPWKGTVTIWQVHLARLSVRILGFNCVHASWFFLFFFFWPSSSSNEVPSEKDYENNTAYICITKTAVVCKRPDQRRIYREAHSALLSLSLST